VRGHSGLLVLVRNHEVASQLPTPRQGQQGQSPSDVFGPQELSLDPQGLPPVQLAVANPPSPARDSSHGSKGCKVDGAFSGANNLSLESFLIIVAFCHCPENC
jgi:hypothetical protein